MPTTLLPNNITIASVSPTQIRRIPLESAAHPLLIQPLQVEHAFGQIFPMHTSLVCLRMYCDTTSHPAQ